MEKRAVYLSGLISSDGLIKMDQMAILEMNEMAKRFPGKRFVMNIEILSDESSKALRGYFYKFVLPSMQRVFYDCGNRLTLDQTENEILKLSHVTNKRDSLKYINDLDNSELCEVIDQCKQIACEYGSGIFIEDSRNILVN